MLEPITLSPDELDQVMLRVAPTGIEYGAARICRYLAQESLAITRNVNTRCSVANISDLVSKAINPKISDLNLYVACIKPPAPVYNRYGQPTGQCLWAFFRDTAANQPVYDESNPEGSSRPLRSDLKAFMADYDEQYPLGKNESSEAFEDVLSLKEFNKAISSVDWLLPPSIDLSAPSIDFDSDGLEDAALPTKNETRGRV